MSESRTGVRRAESIRAHVCDKCQSPFKDGATMSLAPNWPHENEGPARASAAALLMGLVFL